MGRIWSSGTPTSNPSLGRKEIVGTFPRQGQHVTWCTLDYDYTSGGTVGAYLLWSSSPVVRTGPSNVGFLRSLMGSSGIPIPDFSNSGKITTHLLFSKTTLCTNCITLPGVLVHVDRLPVNNIWIIHMIQIYCWSATYQHEHIYMIQMTSRRVMSYVGTKIVYTRVMS